MPSCFGMKVIQCLGPLLHKSLVLGLVKLKTGTFWYFPHRDFDRMHLFARLYPLYISAVGWTSACRIFHLLLKRTHLYLANRYGHLCSWTLLWTNHRDHQSFFQGCLCVRDSLAAPPSNPICTFWWSLLSYERWAGCRRRSDWQRPGSW